MLLCLIDVPLHYYKGASRLLQGRGRQKGRHIQVYNFIAIGVKPQNLRECILVAASIGTVASCMNPNFELY